MNGTYPWNGSLEAGFDRPGSRCASLGVAPSEARAGAAPSAQSFSRLLLIIVASRLTVILALRIFINSSSVCRQLAAFCPSALAAAARPRRWYFARQDCGDGPHHTRDVVRTPAPGRAAAARADGKKARAAADVELLMKMQEGQITSAAGNDDKEKDGKKTAAEGAGSGAGSEGRERRSERRVTLAGFKPASKNVPGYVPVDGGARNGESQRLMSRVREVLCRPACRAGRAQGSTDLASGRCCPPPAAPVQPGTLVRVPR